MLKHRADILYVRMVRVFGVIRMVTFRPSLLDYLGPKWLVEGTAQIGRHWSP